MKKLFWLTLAALVAAASFQSCKEPEPEPEPTNVVATVTASNLVDAAAAAYEAWEENTTIPTTLEVGGKSLTLPQYQYAICKLLVNLASGDKSDIGVIGYKEADHPERDSYDQKEIAVTGGPKITEGTEDLVDIAKRMIAAMADKLTVPNQTVITRTGASAIAFSTNRATVTILRALAEYKSKGSLPAKVSTDYLSAAATLKGFAQQFVGILDIWDKTVGTVSADGSHCTDNNSAWKNVHFVPIPWSGGAYADGVDQYDAKYQPYFTVTVDGKEYTSAQTWGIALRGIMDMITKEGSGTLQQARNSFIHTMGNGASLKEPIPAVNAFDIWGQYPWYESTNDGVPINKDAISPYIIARTASWFLTRQQSLEKIGNYQIYGTDDASELIEDGYTGFISAMRMWLIAARFYKYLLDNNITENVYDAVKDVTFATDLYGVEMPDITSANNSVSLDSDGNEVTFSFNAKKAWTATASEPWIHVDPASGPEGTNIVLKVTADPNTGAVREGKITLKGGNVDAFEIAVTQSKYIAPSAASLKEFAQEFVKGLDVWSATVGTVESESEHLIEKGTAWENAHFIPIVPNPNCEYLSHAGNQYDPKYTPWVLNVAGQEISSSQAWEIAIRGLMNMVTTEGEAFLQTMDNRNKAYTLGNNQSFSEAGMPNASEANQWGKHPWYEGANSDLVTYNGAPIETVDVNFMVKVGAWHVVRSFIPAGSNSPLGMVGNFQQFGTDSGSLNLDGYSGLIAPMRELLILMRIYKYILDNNVDANVYDAIKDQRFDFDLYNQGSAAVEFTLKDFAKEFVKGLDVWGETVGNVDADGYRNSQSAQGAWLNVHYIPIGNTNNSDFKDYGNNQYDDGKTPWTINVAGTTYTSAQAWEMAIRGLLNMCTTEGEAFLDGMTDRNKAYTLGDGVGLKSAIPVPSEANKWGKNPWYEYDDLVTYNGNLIEKVDVNFMLKVGAWHVVRSFIAVGSNSPLGMIGNFQQFGTSSSTLNLDGYSGLISPMRELLVLMRIYKYLLDNNIEENVYSAIKDKQFDFWLYGPNGDVSAPTLKAFAQEFVKGLDVWAATVGTVESESEHLIEKGTAWQNAHFIPIVPNPNCEYLSHTGNQYDAQYTPWVLNVSGQEVSSSQAWEIAIRGLLNLVTAEGEGLLPTMDTRNKAYTLQDNGTLKDVMPSPSAANQWGKHPWYEGANSDLVTYNGNAIETVDVNFMVKVGAWHVVRSFIKTPGNSSPLGMIGNFQQFGTDSGSLNLEGYSGLISPMREMLVLMRIYKDILDNNVNSNVYTAIKDKTYSFDLYGYYSFDLYGIQ
jgi:hypothetical protein